jgi:hypothetical protein
MSLLDLMAQIYMNALVEWSRENTSLNYVGMAFIYIATRLLVHLQFDP